MVTRLFWAVMLLFVAANSHADAEQYDIYLRVAGGSGESMQANHKGWSDLLGFTHYSGDGVKVSFGHPSKNSISHTGDRFEIIKTIDSVTPVLANAAASKIDISWVEIEVCLANQKRDLVLRYELEDVQVSHSHIKGDSKDQGYPPIHGIVFSYAKLKVADNRMTMEDEGKAAESYVGEVIPIEPMPDAFEISDYDRQQQDRHHPPPEACPRGLVWNGKHCEPEHQQCPPGQQHNGERCVCPPGLRWNGEGCVPRHPERQPGDCPEGFIWNGEACEPYHEGCPPGQHRDGERCVCPRGLRWNGEACEPRHEERRPSVYNEREPRACPPGQHRDGERCVCPRGLRWNDEHCELREQREHSSDRNREEEQPNCPEAHYWNGRSCIPNEGVSDRMRQLLR